MRNFRRYGVGTGCDSENRVRGGNGMGKTAFALNIASFLTIHQPYVVGFFSLEMSSEQPP